MQFCSRCSAALAGKYGSVCDGVFSVDGMALGLEVTHAFERENSLGDKRRHGNRPGNRLRPATHHREQGNASFAGSSQCSLSYATLITMRWGEGESLTTRRSLIRFPASGWPEMTKPSQNTRRARTRSTKKRIVALPTAEPVQRRGVDPTSVSTTSRSAAASSPCNV